MQLHDLEALLDGLGQRSGNEWFGIWDRALEISVQSYESMAELHTAIATDGWTSFELDRLWNVANELHPYWVDVRVSGRIDGQAEMRRMVDLLLAGGGYAFHDHSDHLWNLAQIREGLPDGQVFRA